MTEKAPAGVISFYNVPEGAPDPVVDVYVNNVKVETGGGGGGDITVYEIDENKQCNVSVNEVLTGGQQGQLIVFTYNTASGPVVMAPTYISSYQHLIDLAGVCIYDAEGSPATTQVTLECMASSNDEKPILFYIPD